MNDELKQLSAHAKAEKHAVTLDETIQPCLSFNKTMRIVGRTHAYRLLE